MSAGWTPAEEKSSPVQQVRGMEKREFKGLKGTCSRQILAV
jgi:hypothetical protein